MPGETEGQSARPPSITADSLSRNAAAFEKRFCAECWDLPARAE